MSTINKEEIQKFSNLADEWWDVNGKFKPLHMFNPTRIEYITDQIKGHYKLQNKKDNVLNGLKILDIGSGGGLISEPMARLGANVTGIDAAEKNVKIAQLHAKENNLNIRYLNKSPEQLKEFENLQKTFKKRWNYVYCNTQSYFDIIYKSNYWCRIYTKMAANWNS